jgi:hypothetical protein
MLIMKQPPNPGPQTSDHQRCQLEFRLPGVAVARKATNGYGRVRTATDGYRRLFPHPADPIRTLMNTFSRCLTPFHTVKKSLAPLPGHSLCVLTLTWVPLDVGSWMLNVQCSGFIPTSRPFRLNPTQSDLLTRIFFATHRNPKSTIEKSNLPLKSPSQSKPVQHAFFTPSRPTPYDRVEQPKSL